MCPRRAAIERQLRKDVTSQCRACGKLPREVPSICRTKNSKEEPPVTAVILRMQVTWHVKLHNQSSCAIPLPKDGIFCRSEWQGNPWYMLNESNQRYLRAETWRITTENRTNAHLFHDSITTGPSRSHTTMEIEILHDITTTKLPPAVSNPYSWSPRYQPENILEKKLLDKWPGFRATQSSRRSPL